MVRPGMIPAFALVFWAACASPTDRQERLIPPGDQDYTDLETPEATGECTLDEECAVGCQRYQCAPLQTGPITCPQPPPPVPPRLEAAYCLCDGSVCAYFEWQE